MAKSKLTTTARAKHCYKLHTLHVGLQTVPKH